MAKTAVYALLCVAALGLVSAQLESTRLGRKLSTLCHMDNCGVWCGPPRGGRCAMSQPPCNPPNKIDCFPPSHGGGWSNRECPRYCGPQPWSQNPGQCGGNIYVCHDPPPCNLPTEVFCPWNSNSPECVRFCGPVPELQQRQPCGGHVFICEAPPVATTPPEEKGCFPGNTLPFGLENCLCDGVEVGEPAGLAACGRVFNECANNLQPFSLGQLEAVQQICDTFALDACISSSQNALVQNPGCADLLRNGSPRCTPQQATSIWMESVNSVCDPLCKDCARLGP